VCVCVCLSVCVMGEVVLRDRVLMRVCMSLSGRGYVLHDRVSGSYK